ncbi:MAG TPA: glycosyltransferase [Pyrinomonadaceae bacterium]|nr:glycosyltransferase [Pyrinomonadaceae bacterium]
MRILRIIARLNVGGPARHVVWLTEALNDDEFQSLLLAGTVPEGEEDMEYFAREHGVEPRFVREMSRELSIKDAVTFFKIFGEIRRYRPDIIHTHTAKAGTVGRAAAFLHKLLGGRVRVVHTFHGHVFHSYYGAAKTRVFVAIEKFLARVVTDRIVVISTQQLKEIHNDFGVGSADQFSVIPLGIDVEPFANAGGKRSIIRDQLGIADDRVLVGFVGRLTEIKDLSLYLQVAARTCRGAESMPVHFVTAGDGHMRAALEKEAGELSLEGRHSFLGNQTDAAAIYAAVDIVALTSLNEGTPLSLIEAMAAGRPVISTVVGGVVDLLGETVSIHEGFRVCERGIGIDSRSPDDFTKGLIYLMKNERLRETLALAGQKFARDTYSKQRLVEDIKKLYRELKAGD